MSGLCQAGRAVPLPANCSKNKHLSTLGAQFALRGYTFDVHQRDGRPLYTVGRWGMNRSFTHENDLQAFLRQVGGAS